MFGKMRNNCSYYQLIPDFFPQNTQIVYHIIVWMLFLRNSRSANIQYFAHYYDTYHNHCSAIFFLFVFCIIITIINNNN